MLIRRARPSDAEELAILAERTFRKTFEAGNTQKDMELHCQASYSTDIQLQEILREDWITLVCEYESKLIGYAQLRWEAFPPCVNSIHAGEILCLYIDEHYHGKGFAQALIHKCFAEFAAQGSDIVWLVSGNITQGQSLFTISLGLPRWVNISSRLGQIPREISL